MNKIIYIILAAISMFAATSCIEDDFTTSSSDILAFNTDTVAFDTVITKQGTITKQFVVYNKSKKQLNISSVRVTGESDAKFYINVDGLKGKEFHDIELRGNDSLYVFVEGYIDELKKDTPTEFTDHIEFVTNGVTQKVTINAWGQDVTRITGDTIWEDVTYTAAKPYLIYDTLVVAPGATLRVNPGAKLLFHKGAALKVYGRMFALGNKDEHITLKGDRIDKVVADIDFDIMSGQWGGVVFGVGSFGSNWEFVDMTGSEFGLQTSSNNPGKQTLQLLNCLIHNSSGPIFTSWNAKVTAYGTEFSEAAEGVVYLYGGNTTMQHCTITNYYLFKAVTDPLLNVFNIDDPNCPPIMADIDNCILYGMPSDINAGDLSGTDIYLRNCLLKSNGTDDDNFINIVWGGDPKYYTVREDYIFDYRVKPESDAIARGDRSIVSSRARYDRYGQDRFAESAPTLGAYVYVAPTEDGAKAPVRTPASRL